MHPSIRPLVEYFNYDHLPENLQKIAKPYRDLALQMVKELGEDEDGFERDFGGGAQLNRGLQKLLESKDAMVRSALTLGRMTN